MFPIRILIFIENLLASDSQNYVQSKSEIQVDSNQIPPRMEFWGKVP